MQRRLAAEGSVNRDVCERARKKMAVELLENTDSSLGEIATELGYSSLANFPERSSVGQVARPAIFETATNGLDVWHEMTSRDRFSATACYKSRSFCFAVACALR
jgi:AraC-like DNA-binding protein